MASPRQTTLDQLRRVVEGHPGQVDAQARLGRALVEAGLTEEGASHLRLAAQLVPADAQLALTACVALVNAGRERDAALLLSSQIQPQRGWTTAEPSVLRVVTRLLHHPESFVRCHAARGVGRVRLQQGAALLEPSCHDRDGAVRLAAQAARRRLLAH